MFHAFHCLASMRTAFQKMNETKTTLEKLQKGDHVAHCFDYLKNVIFCMADGKSVESCGEMRLTLFIQILLNSRVTRRDILGERSLRVNGMYVHAATTRSYRILWKSMESGGDIRYRATMMRSVFPTKSRLMLCRPKRSEPGRSHGDHLIAMHACHTTSPGDAHFVG